MDAPQTVEPVNGHISRKETLKGFTKVEEFEEHLSRGIRSNIIQRGFKSSSRNNAKVVMALYEDPQAGYPPPSLRGDLPEIQKYPDGQTLPSPEAVDFSTGDLLEVYLESLDFVNFWRIEVTLLS